MWFRKLCTLLVVVLLLTGRNFSYTDAAERERIYAPLTDLSVTYVPTLTMQWSPSTHYEDDLEDMVTLIGTKGYDKTYVYWYRFTIDHLSLVMVKYKGDLRKTKHGTLDVRLSRGFYSDGNIIIGDKRLDKNEDYWIGILSKGTYYLKVPIEVESPGNPFYDDGWRDTPYLKFDVTAKRIYLFLRSGTRTLSLPAEDRVMEIRKHFEEQQGR